MAFKLEIFASDPRSRLQEWFPITDSPLLSTPNFGNFQQPKQSSTDQATQQPNYLFEPPSAELDLSSSKPCAGPLEYAAEVCTLFFVVVVVFVCLFVGWFVNIFALQSNAVCAWFDILLKPNSTVNVSYPWYPRTSEGSKLEILVDLKSPSLTTSATSSLGNLFSFSSRLRIFVDFNLRLLLYAVQELRPTARFSRVLYCILWRGTESSFGTCTLLYKRPSFTSCEQIWTPCWI